MSRLTLSPLLVALALLTTPLDASATIVIGNPNLVRGQASGVASVQSMTAPVAAWRPFRCDGSAAPIVPVHQVLDLVSDAGFALPAGTWCRVDALLEGPVLVETQGQLDVVLTPVIRLLPAANITGYELEIQGATGSLVANVDDT